jgi:hypothetical protein
MQYRADEKIRFFSSLLAELNASEDCLLQMNIPKNAEAREHRIDESLKETFPAGDTPSYVGAGAPPDNEQVVGKYERGQDQPTDNKRHNALKKA